MRTQTPDIAHGDVGLTTEEHHHQRRVFRPHHKASVRKNWQKTADVQFVYSVRLAFVTSLILLMFLVQHGI